MAEKVLTQKKSLGKQNPTAFSPGRRTNEGPRSSKKKMVNEKRAKGQPSSLQRQDHFTTFGKKTQRRESGGSGPSALLSFIRTFNQRGNTGGGRKADCR